MQRDPISAEFPFESRWVEVEGARMHYVEVGEGRPALFLHGNPTWSYLWRNVLPYAAPSARCIAVDLVGMGRSDKPDLEYRFVEHARYLAGFIDALGLERLALVGHDWGSALGFDWARRNESRVRGLAFMEALLRPLSTWEELPAPAREVLQSLRTEDVGWRLVVDENPSIERLLPGAVLRPLDPAEMEAYRAPFAEPASRKPLWRWPNELPIAGEPADVVETVTAYSDWLQRTVVPKLLLYAEPGALVPAARVAWCREHLPSLVTMPVGRAGHYLQEDVPQTVGEALAIWLRALPG
jgi:haloalkane dehalogenase